LCQQQKSSNVLCIIARNGPICQRLPDIFLFLFPHPHCHFQNEDAHNTIGKAEKEILKGVEVVREKSIFRRKKAKVGAHWVICLWG
jgi:hypothetical protein